MQSTLIERTLKIRLMVLNVDGVLTDGRLYLNAAGEETKAFHVLDGAGIKLLKGSGVEVAVVSSRTSSAVDVWAKEHGVAHVFQSVENTVDVCHQLVEKLGLSMEQVAYVGDDVMDIGIMRRVGLAVAVPDSPSLVREACHYVTSLHGGQGAVREACEFVMQIQGTYDRQISRFLA